MHVDIDDEVLKGQGKKNTLNKCIILMELIKMDKKSLILSNILWVNKLQEVTKKNIASNNSLWKKCLKWLETSGSHSSTSSIF